MADDATALPLAYGVVMDVTLLHVSIIDCDLGADMTKDDRYNEGFSAGRTASRAELADTRCTGPEGRPYWLDEPCPQWCVARHCDNDHYEDRAHYSEDEEVLLRLEKLDHESSARMTASLWLHYREREPRVNISKNGATGVDVSLAELDSLVGGLQRLANQARNEGGHLAVGLRPVA